MSNLFLFFFLPGFRYVLPPKRIGISWKKGARHLSLSSAHTKITTAPTFSGPIRVMHSLLGASNALLCYMNYVIYFGCLCRWKELEMGKMATGFGLLQFPSIPEVKNHTLSIVGFSPVEDINLEDIKFRYGNSWPFVCCTLLT